MVIQNTPTKIDKIASLRIGQRGENLATDIKMDVSDWITVHPDANYYCLFKRPDEVQVQPVLSSLEEDVLTWTVRAWECAIIGVGYLEVRAVNPDTGLVAKSRVIPCAIEDSVIDDEGPVPPEMTWVGEVLAAKDTAVAAKTAAEEARDTAQTTVNGAIAGIQAEGTTQVGNVNTAGTTQVGNVNTAGATQVGAVQSEGTTQVGAVQAKGTEVLNSIPSDYTTLSDDVTGLKSAINEIDETVYGEKNYLVNQKIITAAGDTRGSLTSDSNFSVSELIPISDMPTSGSTLNVDYGTIPENTMFGLYDSQGGFIDSWALQSSATSRAFTFNYASYTNLAYVRFAFKKGYSAKITSQNGTITYWTAQNFGGLVNDVNTIESIVTTLPSTFMPTDTYIDKSMVNRLNPLKCDLNSIVIPSTGAIDSNNNYFTTDYIPIGTNETLYFYRIDTKEIKSVRRFAAYDANKIVISDHGSTSEVTSITQSDNMAYIKASLPYVASDYARTPEDTAALSNANPVYISGYGNSPVIKTQYLERHTMWVRSTDTEAQIIQKFVDAFNTGNVDVYFERATYQFGTELAKVNTDYGMIHNEIPIGNGCQYYFNGSTLIATIDLTQHPAVGNDEFYCNFFGCQRRPSSYELHDGVLIATDTRYVVHDESTALSGSYKHLYQNMEMHYHTNQRQETIRKCIGGGTGASGVVEIIGCKFTTDAVDSCVSYHGNGSDVVGAEFDLNIRDSWFSNNIRAGELSANQTARLFYTGNSAANSPLTYDRWTVTAFLNEVRT